MELSHLSAYMHTRTHAASLFGEMGSEQIIGISYIKCIMLTIISECEYKNHFGWIWRVNDSHAIAKSILDHPY